MSDNFLEQYVQELKSTLPPGVNIVGGLAARMRLMYRMAGADSLADIVTFAPGERVLSFSDDDPLMKVGLGAPIAADV